MFCSHCGTDCRDANFCPKCGREVGKGDAQQSFTARKKALQAAGEVFCPKCLSTRCNPDSSAGSPPPSCRTLGTTFLILNRLVLDNLSRDIKGSQYVCSQCGHAWYPKREALYERYRAYVQPLLGQYSSMKYPGTDGAYLELTTDQIMFCHSKKKGCMLLLEEIALIEYRRPFGPLYGRLSLRDRTHKNKPFPKSLDAAKKDRYTIFFELPYEKQYEQIRSALESIIGINQKEGHI